MTIADTIQLELLKSLFFLTEEAKVSTQDRP